MMLLRQCTLIGWITLTSMAVVVAQERLTLKTIKINGVSSDSVTQHSIELKALDDDVIFVFSPYDSVQYQYFLMGYDKDTVLSDYPEIRYTNLPGGEYTLYSSAIRGKHMVASYSIPVQIEASLTESGWFIPAVVAYAVLLISAGVYFFLLYNFRQKLKVQHLRNRIAADLHDEVGATLSSIAIATKVVEKKLKPTERTELLPILNQIKQDSEESIQHIRDTVWTINPDNDSLPQLFEKIRSFALQILQPQGITLEFLNGVSPAKVFKMSMEQRRNVYLIIKEAVNNIAKHSAATLAVIEISEQPEGIHIVVTDNGKGFDLHQQTEGNGLRNFKKRATESFMELDLRSVVGQGTTLSLLVIEV
ncbi:MAG: histidine kinase [Spirosomataceae bacterium]